MTQLCTPTHCLHVKQPMLAMLGKLWDALCAAAGCGADAIGVLFKGTMKYSRTTGRWMSLCGICQHRDCLVAAAEAHCAAGPKPTGWLLVGVLLASSAAPCQTCCHSAALRLWRHPLVTAPLQLLHVCPSRAGERGSLLQSLASAIAFDAGVPYAVREAVLVEGMLRCVVDVQVSCCTQRPLASGKGVDPSAVLRCQACHCVRSHVLLPALRWRGCAYASKCIEALSNHSQERRPLPKFWDYQRSIQRRRKTAHTASAATQPAAEDDTAGMEVWPDKLLQCWVSGADMLS